MQQFATAVRDNVPQAFSYVYYDASGAVIPLTSYTSCTLELKLQGQTWTNTAANITNASAGQVSSAAVLISGVGPWMGQFVCQDADGNLLYGEPVTFEVVENVDEAPVYQILPA